MQSAKCEPVEDKVEQFTEEKELTIGAESDTEDREHRFDAEAVRELVEETMVVVTDAESEIMVPVDVEPEE
ncbi:hypothetical protein [Mycobacterium lepromatosis]|nr:hypothetical protein [Mycobacterium lepromatosis]UKN42407.1 hypothetical protein MLPF_1809 [Mycobacterium lepromatosis]